MDPATHLTYGVPAAIWAFCSNNHKWGTRDEEKSHLSVIQCYCPTCRRTVYAEDTESPECPVCLTPVFVSSEKTPERPNAGKKNGSSTKS